MIVSCNPNKKKNVRTAKVEQTATEESIEQNVSDKIEKGKEKLSQDSMYMILHGANSLPDSIGNRLPKNAKDYFSQINFPYKFPKDFSIDYYCKKEIFQIEDLFIFKTKNGYRTCEYIALIDTFSFVEIIAQNCNEMENWIALYVLNEDYKIIHSGLLLNVGGEYMVKIDDKWTYMNEVSPLKFGNQNIKFSDLTDTLTYSNRQYRIYSDEVFEITYDSGKIEKDNGIRRLKMFTVDERGRVIKQCDSIVYKKEYYDMFWTKRE